MMTSSLRLLEDEIWSPRLLFLHKFPILNHEKRWIVLNNLMKNGAARAWTVVVFKAGLFSLSDLLNPIEIQSKTLKYLTSLLEFLSNRKSICEVKFTSKLIKY
jgi:hypothetical protein